MPADEPSEILPSTSGTVLVLLSTSLKRWATTTSTLQKLLESKAEIKEGDILIINTGYNRYGWDQEGSDELRYFVPTPRDPAQNSTSGH